MGIVKSPPYCDAIGYAVVWFLFSFSFGIPNKYNLEVQMDYFAIERVGSEGPDVMVRYCTPIREVADGGWRVMICYH